MYPITRFNSWQMQLCVIAGPVSWPRKCGIYRGVVTERDERDESSSFFSFLFLFSLSFLFFFSSLFLHFFFFPFSFLFLFLFSPVSFLVGSVDFLASVYIQVYNNVRWNGGIFRLAGARAVGESVSLESIENCEGIMLVGFFFWEHEFVLEIILFFWIKNKYNLYISLNFWNFSMVDRNDLKLIKMLIELRD